MFEKENPNESHLEVYKNRSILIDQEGKKNIFFEGKQSSEASKRVELVKRELQKGFLNNLINQIRNSPDSVENIEQKHLLLLKKLVDSVTSEVGRALVGLTVLQLCIKCICPEQSIRLHKSGPNNTTNFSWKEGIPMRTIDKDFITPVLREQGLLHLNADGFMMTRTLAENYPYSYLYKAAMRGGKDYWLEIVELIELNQIDPMNTLKNLLSLLINKSDSFKQLCDATLLLLESKLSDPNFHIDYFQFIDNLVEQSTYSARIFEVAVHSLLQAIEDKNELEYYLKPLSQMRSANKKHGNVGDIELLEFPNTSLIAEAWDAKYGKNYLRDELEELNEKLNSHPETKIVGFITNKQPDLKDEILTRVSEISSQHSVQILILSFEDWFKYIIETYGLKTDEIGRYWMIAFTESFCQKRREKAPIDEPCNEWVSLLNKNLKSDFL